VLVFFASWCPPCRNELPEIASAIRRFQVAKVPVDFIGIDGNDSTAAGLAVVRQSGVTFVVGSDFTQKVARSLGLSGLPDTVLVSPNGRIEAMVRGAISTRTLDEWVSGVAATG
jgi:cytochrome c-type biogenesis protein